nr:sp110 nuclear body protein isoform X2 [Microcebus murinus]
MFTVPRALEEALFQHFIYQKMEIAYAIHKPFPFLESLRDKSFITNRMYKESLEACSNLVPISRVVHNILTKLEKTFSLPLLVTLFSEINLREYPNLKTIFKSFKSVTNSYGQWSRATPSLLEVPPGPAEGRSLQPLPLLPPPPPPPRSCPHCVSRGSEPGASSQQSHETPGGPPSSSDPAVSLPGLMQEGRRTAVTHDNLTSKMNEQEDSRKMPSPAPDTVQVSSDNLTPQIKDEEDPQEMPRAPSGPTPVVRDESLERNDPKEPQEVFITPSKKKGNKRKRSIWSTPKKRHQKKKLPREITDGTSEMNKRKKSQATPSTPPTVTQEKSIKRWSSPRRRQEKSLPRGATSPGHGIQEKLPVAGQVTQRKTNNSTYNSKIMTRAQKARLNEKPKEDAMDFQCPNLPVTCGKEKGMLHVERMKLGPSKKCIQNEEGVRLTAKEFEIKGKGRNTEDWKQSVRCRRKSLRQMLKE